jgi:hypothetical protein
VYIRCRGNVSIELLPSSIQIQTYRGMGGIYEMRSTKFHKDWFGHSKVDRYMDTETGRTSHKPNLRKHIKLFISYYILSRVAR